MDEVKFGEAIGHYWSSVQQWELNEIYPKLNTIKDICDTFNVDLKYFGDYYYWVFNNPGKKFKELGVFEELKKKKAINYDDVPIKFKAWKEKMSSSNLECAEILNVSVPTIKRLLKGKTKFIELYEWLKELKII